MDKINPKDCQVLSKPLVILGGFSNFLGLFQVMTRQTPTKIHQKKPMLLKAVEAVPLATAQPKAAAAPPSDAAVMEVMKVSGQIKVIPKLWFRIRASPPQKKNTSLQFRFRNKK